MPRIRTPLSPTVAILALATTPACAPDVPGVPEVNELLPFASSGAPLSATDDIAIVSEEIACVIDSYESRIHCVDRSDGGVAVFGREGEGPGEFDGLTGIERGPGGQVVAMDYGSARMTFFEPDGSLVSEAPLPPRFQPSQLRGDRLFGFELGMPDFASGETQPTFVPMAADARSGEVLWQRTDLADAVGLECFSGAVGASTPDGGLVFEVCGNELAFFAGRVSPERSPRHDPPRNPHAKTNPETGCYALIRSPMGSAKDARNMPVVIHADSVLVFRNATREVTDQQGRTGQ